MIVLNIIADDIQGVNILFIVNSVQFFHFCEFILAQIYLLQTIELLDSLKGVHETVDYGQLLDFFESI